MKTISLGKKQKKFRSIKEAAAAAGVPYITFYMRLRSGKPVKSALKTPVRTYTRKTGEALGTYTKDTGTAVATVE
jgi:hypothetical protein